MRRRTSILFLLALPCLSACSGYVADHAERGDGYYSRGMYREAVAEYDKAVRFDPDNPRIVRQLGFAHYALGQMREAQAYLTKGEELEPKNIQVRLVLGNLDLLYRHPEEALKEAQTILAAEPRNVSALRLRGGAYAAQGNMAEAGAAYGEIAELTPTSPDGPFLLGQTLLAAGNRDAAARQFDEALSRKPDHLDALTARVQIDLADGRSDDAMSRLQRLLLATGDSSGGAPRTAPSVKARLLDLLGVVRMARNETQAAQSAFLQATEAESAYTGGRVHLAQLYARLGRTDDALVELDHAMKIDSTNADIYMTQGLLYQRLHNVSKAIQSYERVLKLSPSAPAEINLASLLSDSGTDLPRALALAKSAHDAFPQEPHVADTYGWILQNAGQSLAAVKVLEEAAARAPDDARIQYHLGVALEATGDRVGARRALSSAVNSSAEFPDKDAARKTLARLQ